jgi:histidine triad (HIT) family protein
MSCKYCQIAEKQIPAHILYEDQSVVAFLEENPVSKGHALVIPREHAETYSQLTDVAGFASGLQEFLKLMEERVSPHLNLVTNQGRKAGQDIRHFHMHVIPRYEGEKIFEWTWHQLSPEEAEEVKNKIKG